MSNKLALCALLLVAFVFSASMGVSAQKKASRIQGLGVLEPVPEANPAVNLDQCQNGAVGSPAVDCAPGWANGNSNGNNSHYAEGTNIHYRARFSNLVIGTSYTVTLEYDRWHQDSTHNAIDYLNTYDAAGGAGNVPVTAYDIVPCDGVQTGCAGATSTFPIDDEPCHAFDVNDGSRVWTGWGMTITDTVLVNPGDCDTQQKQVTVTFTANSTSPVLAWSGHIARAVDWNTVGETSASSIQGSPYHMRIAGNTGWGGQQDRSLSTTAVTQPSAAPASVTGRVTDAYGRGIYGARVTLVNATSGAAATALTNSFGYYRFNEVPTGDFYVMSVSARRYLFVNGTTSFSLEDNLAGIDFQASN